jgi:hypothetical protein
MAYDLFGTTSWPDGSGSLFETETNPQGRILGVRMTVPPNHAVRIKVWRGTNVLVDRRWPDSGLATVQIVEEFRVPPQQVADGIEYACEMT